MIIIVNTYEIGEIVYLKTDPDALPRIVTGLYVDKQGPEISESNVLYTLNCGVELSKHYDYEMCKKPVLDLDKGQ